MQNLYDVLIKKLEQNEKFLLEDSVSPSKVRESAYKLEPELIKILFDEPKLKEQFFQEIENSHCENDEQKTPRQSATATPQEGNSYTVFHYQKFSDFISNKQFLPDSYTKFETTVGLTANDQFLSKNKDVVLSFPHKDCILEGGMDKEDAEARKEVFYNQTLAPDDVHKLKSPKALKNWKKYGVSEKLRVKSEKSKDENSPREGWQSQTDGVLPTELKLNPDGTFDENFIIKGNNLLGLYSLLPRYRGKIKLIYIDPPYNTGNDGFKYNDNFNHSTWLVFMKNRLEIARDLLSDDGLIFIHCDKNEHAYLKVLLDEIYDENNYIETITVVNNPRGRDYGGVANMHEYIHIYKKTTQADINPLDNPNKEFPFKDEDGGFETRELRNRNTAFNSKSQPNLVYPFYLNPQNQDENGFFEISLQKQNGWIEVMPAKSQGIQTVWRWGKEKAEKNLNSNICGKGMKEENRYQIVEKYRETTRLARSVWWDKEVNSERGTLHLKQLFGKKVFDFPKPEETLKRVIEMATNENDIVLDYHLGSGTTCAVAHKMGRRYIGVEQMDYVETIAVERLKKVVGKVGESDDLMGESKFEDFDTGGISKAVNWQGGGSFVYCELAKNNLEYLEKIDALTSKNKAREVFEELADSIWISYRVDVDKFKDKKGEFMEMELKDQKQVLRDIINYNHLYVNYEDMEDEMYAGCGLTKQDKALTKEFYEGEFGSEELITKSEK